MELAAGRPVVWKKLDEEDRAGGDSEEDVHGDLQGGFASGELEAVSGGGGFLSEAPRTGIRGLAADPVVGPVVELLLAEEAVDRDGGGGMR